MTRPTRRVPSGGPGPGAGSGPGGGNKNIPDKKVQEIVDRFEISLHATRRGKERFSSAEWIDENGNAFDNGGFEQFVAKFYPEHAD